jgi:hypothetical protein
MARTAWRTAIACAGATSLAVALPSTQAGETRIDPLLDLRTAWSCTPSAIYLQPGSDDAAAAVGQWREAFRPDWSMTTERDAADVVVLLRDPVDSDAAGLATIWATTTTRVHAQVEVMPSYPAVDDLVRHELGHVAGLGHALETQFSSMSAFPLLHRYGAGDLARLAAAGRVCTVDGGPPARGR